MKKTFIIPVGSLILLIATYTVVHSLWSKLPAELKFPDNPVHEDFITLSHAGLQAHDLEKALEFYETYFGLQEAFRLYNDDGSLRLVYIHVSGNTFIEFTARTKERREDRLEMAHSGITHLAIQVKDIEQAVANVKARGIPKEYLLSDAIFQGPKDHSLIFNFIDPDGNRVEFMEFGPEAEQYKAMKKVAQ
jgi:catechol 2,3-dioxygenase-like lactoylglutathione lyase family enzyme